MLNIRVWWSCCSALKLATWRLFFTALVISLVACAGNSAHAPVVERRAPVTYVPTSHTVVRGETIYSIAWRYGLDHKALAAKNRIMPPYLIQPGQKLSLRSSGVDSKAGAKRKHTQTTYTAGATGDRKKAKKSASNKAVPNKDNWYWPAKGRLLKGYSNSGKIHKGIDISGNIGDAVKSTQAGTVVYAGSRLAGYGKLVIVKHKGQYLSAYAHNSRILVSEGQAVKAGSKIAEIGRSGSTQTKLHFEIRLQGKPVNPLSLLPRR